MANPDQNPWQAWLAEIEQRSGPQYPERLRQMLKLYGAKEGHTCKTCRHPIRKHYAKTYYKCDQTKMTNGTGTDWRVSLPACGLYEEGEHKTYLLYTSDAADELP